MKKYLLLFTLLSCSQERKNPEIGEQYIIYNYFTRDPFLADTVTVLNVKNGYIQYQSGYLKQSDEVNSFLDKTEKTK